jgi:hypothetical protein
MALIGRKVTKNVTLRPIELSILIKNNIISYLDESWNGINIAYSINGGQEGLSFHRLT